MADPPSPWDIVFKRMDRLETKIDLLGERVVPRDEFERHKAHEQREREQIHAELKEYKSTVDARERSDRERKESDKAKWRIFWAGLALTPIISGFVTWIGLRGGAG